MNAIPVELCVFILQNRIVNPFKTYLMLKNMCSGKMKFDRDQLCKQLNISDKTLDRHLKVLIKLNWIGFDPKSMMLFIRGFDKIREMNQFNSRLAIICTQADFKTFTAFLFGAVVSNVLRAKKRQQWQPGAAKKGNAPQPGRQPFFYPIANGYMAKILNYSVKGMVKLKQQAESIGYILTKENKRLTGEPFSNIDKFKNMNNPERHLLKKSGNEIGIQKPDLISTKMEFSRRTKSATLIKGLRGK
jgi:hypothetical protein